MVSSNFLADRVHKDRKQALQFFVTLIDKYGKMNLEGKGEDIILRYAVDVVTQISLLLHEPDYFNLARRYDHEY